MACWKKQNYEDNKNISNYQERKKNKKKVKGINQRKN